MSGLRTLGQKDLDKSLADAAKSAAWLPSRNDHIATLKTEIAEGLDTSIAAVRKQVTQAVASGRAIVMLGVSGIVQFEAWVALKNASADEEFKSLPMQAIKIAQGKAQEAVHWHRRQTEDSRLRLKALAAHYFVEPQKDALAICPLCRRPTDDTGEQKKLATELADPPASTPPLPRERPKMHAPRSTVNCARC